MARFSMLDTSTIGKVSVPKRRAPEISRLELSKDVSFGIGNPLGCREIELRKSSLGGVIHSVVYARREGGEEEAPLCP